MKNLGSFIPNLTFLLILVGSVISLILPILILREPENSNNNFRIKGILGSSVGIFLINIISFIYLYIKNG